MIDDVLVFGCVGDVDVHRLQVVDEMIHREDVWSFQLRCDALEKIIVRWMSSSCSMLT